ncbi:hypothetical protein BDA96_05G207100 [Sorghum bicolor]|uniref:BAG domain-containing protein n=1 Tax=Sorghum bicolor TaxID=4558 RepID=A0A921QZJ4_SORBI|nr:hypothetical protein BDA96_05G207100 [Sorghum bicolor]
MASRRFSGGYEPYGFFGGYDPYDGYKTYYTAAPYQTYYTTSPYDYQYQPQQPAPTRSSAPTKPAPRPARETKTSFSIPVHGPDSEPERETKAARKAGSRADPVAQVMSAEEAAVRMQAAARGFLTRKSVRAVHEVQQEAEQVQMCEVETLVTDPRARAAVAEQLMRMLLRLDAVRGAREYRRKVTKLVLALQDAIDTLEAKPAPSTSAGEGEEEEADANAPEAEATATKMAEESAVPPELLDAAEHGTKMENIIKTEVDEAIAGGEPEVEVGEEQEKEAVLGDAFVDLDKLAVDSDAEGEWEMVTEENEHAAPVAAMSDDQEPPPCNELPADPLETSSTTSASAGAASDGVDVRKVMEMVVALCEQSAKQGAVIGALAERVDMLERTLRRMEEAESCRRRSKKLSAEGEWKEQQQVLQRLMTHSR